jgi:hypothetical protein
MSGPIDAQQCDFCKKGRVITRKQQLAFRQWTDRGYVHCRAEVPIGLCDRCGSQHWNQEAEAIVEEAVRREYEKLPRREAIRTDGDSQREWLVAALPDHFRNRIGARRF